ncbi:tRNA (N6-isopentenyl adenosine(37)-C2)-methylthiotransferase MiaB [bacterium]|nr:tRNA (N6-isopentenyl adenosine(37)-C2)-methylthiotransferase MiaB [bacterium]
MEPTFDIPLLDDLDAPKQISGTSDGKRMVYLETYGCQMNVSDSEIVASVLSKDGYGLTHSVEEADIILINTCAIRENAEQKVRRRLVELRSHKMKVNPDVKLGVLGCMAERLREKLLDQEKLVDLVVGPDAYRDLPNLLSQATDTGQAAVNVQLSKEETYQDIEPVRYATNGVSSFVSIMRGCDNMCSFCVVPFTRGRERSRPVASILDECKTLVENGFREVTVLGQNVNSYRDEQQGGSVDFAELVYRISQISPELRIRYSTSHPKDCSDALLHVHREQANVCNYIHLPVQHGNTDMLQRMKRTYTRDQYLDLVERARKIVPGVALSTDIIAGFCDETEAEHQDTLSLMAQVRYEHAYMFMYSERPDTYAARKFTDNVPEHVKKKRLQEIIEQQSGISLESNQAEIGKEHIILVEGLSRRSDEQLSGRSDTNKMTVFDRQDFKKGDYVRVRITDCTSATLLATPLGRA